MKKTQPTKKLIKGSFEKVHERLGTKLNDFEMHIKGL